MTLLAVSDLHASYGPTPALFGVNLEIGRGEVLALMGRNGMGKSTTVKCICGMLPSTGTITFDQTHLNHQAIHKIARLGIGLVPEGRRCFRSLTVRENLIAASRQGEWTLDKIVSLFPSLGKRLSQPSASLSGGEQQMLAIGRALMTNPRLLLLDEATEGLAPIVRQEIWSVIKALKADTGLSILVIDKSIKELSRVCDRMVILERGRTAWTGTVDQLTCDVMEKYLGV